MYQSYDEAFHALLSDEGLEAARGGQIIKCNGDFTCRLFNQPYNREDEVVFELNPSIEPGETWKWIATTDEAMKAFRAFIADPRNGSLN